ncbi:hypothetical protein V2J09_004595 [Rumex salicifolius]
MAQLLQLPALNRSFSSLLPSNLPRSHSHPRLIRSNPCSVPLHWNRRLSNPSLPLHHSPVSLSPLVCKYNGSDIIPQLEIEKPEQRHRPEKRVNGVRAIKSLYLYHNWPAWYQFITAAFCHANWNHLSSNLFFLYIFGKLVEEEEGNLALWLSYILTGAGANLVSWLVLPRNAVSVGASGAVFGLFAISVLVKMSWDWRKILEVLILGQFVIEKVMEAAQASAGMSNGLVGGNALNSVNHIAHLSGALVGVLLVWLLSITPSPSDKDHTASDKKNNKIQ